MSEPRIAEARNLHRAGVPDKVIQLILLHGNISTTQRCYIKTAAQDAKKGMKKLEKTTIGHLSRLSEHKTTSLGSLLGGSEVLTVQ